MSAVSEDQPLLDLSLSLAGEASESPAGIGEL